jgi:hypothetical protein
MIGMSCASIKEGESWKMLPEDNTIGLTLLWELPEEKLKELLPPGQLPRIRNGKGVLMLFLASTENYSIGKRKLGPLGIAHIIIPLQNSISIPETIGLKKHRIIKGMKQIGFPVRFGEVNLSLKGKDESVEIEGEIKFENGSLSFTGTAQNSKGDLVDLSQTTLVSKQLDERVLSGPEFYRPINFKTIQVVQSGENWMEQFGLSMPPDRIWVNVDFGVEFKYLKKLPTP